MSKSKSKSKSTGGGVWHRRPTNPAIQMGGAYFASAAWAAARRAMGTRKGLQLT